MDDTSELPEKIGKYEILGIAGRGAMGIVYHGHDPFFDRDVAIKTTQTLSDDDAGHGVARKMLFTESQAAANLDHGTIIQVLDFGEFEGNPYVVMEYFADGGTLKTHCHAENLLPVERAVSLIHDCARALDHAHQHGVIHRDIKPNNILLTADDQVKICDFGIATIASAETTEILSTMGSPHYMSPEQLLDQPITARTDLYSLGVVLYELLTGRRMFETQAFAELLRKILTVVPTPIHEIRNDVPRALSDVVARAINKRPDDRFQSGAEFAGALSAIFAELDHCGSFLNASFKFRLARDLRFFDGFADPELREFVEACDWQCVKSGARIIREGNMERSCYILVSGEAAVNQGEQRIGTLSRGSCFGEMGFLSRSSRSATMRARGEATLLVAEANAVASLSPAVQQRFNQCLVDALVERLASTTERLSKFLNRAPD